MSIAKLCAVTRKTWAGHISLLCFAKGAIWPGVRFVRAVITVNSSIAKILSLKTPATVPANGKTWSAAVVTDSEIFIDAIITITIQAITLVNFLPQTHLLTTGSTSEHGRVSNTVWALWYKFISKIIAMLLAVAFELNIHANINTVPQKSLRQLTSEQMVGRTVGTLRRRIVWFVITSGVPIATFCIGNALWTIGTSKLVRWAGKRMWSNNHIFQLDNAWLDAQDRGCEQKRQIGQLHHCQQPGTILWTQWNSLKDKNWEKFRTMPIWVLRRGWCWAKTWEILVLFTDTAFAAGCFW